MYITGLGNISPQFTYEGTTFPEEARNYPGNRLFCVEPEYKNYIGPVQIRRMGRIMKMGISSAKMALADAGITLPDAIMVGTGLGCLEDTEKFLRIMIDDAEQTAAPTPFISSTHNNVAGAIALQIKCLGYNYTYVHKGFSFVSCLYDAALQIQLNQASHVLVGGIDEMTDTKYHNNGLINNWNTQTPDTLNVFEHQSLGSIAGEGSAFFVLSKEKIKPGDPKIIGFKQFYSEEAEDLSEAFHQFLLEHGLLGEEFVLLEGRSGNTRYYPFYEASEKVAGPRAVKAVFKHLCGSYYTSDAFALWSAAQIIKSGHVPAMFLPSRAIQNPRYVVVYDHVSYGEHVFQIISV